MFGVEDWLKKKINEEFIFIFMENFFDMGMRGDIVIGGKKDGWIYRFCIFILVELLLYLILIYMIVN